MSAWRSLLILGLFFVDVRVRAESAKGAVCWGKEIPCAIQSQETRRELKAANFLLSMSAGSLVEQRDDTTVQLVRGEFYIESKSAVKFKTPYASFWCSESCKALVQRQLTALTIKALEGEWVVQRMGDKKEYGLRSGLQVSVSEVETNGMAQMEFPQSLPWKPTVAEWAKLFTGEADAFRSEVTRFRSDWKKAVEFSAQVHEQVAARAVASHEDELAKQAARRKAVLKEEAELRELFRKKNYIDP